MAKLYKRYVIHGHNLDFFCFLVDIIIKLVFCGNFIEIIRALIIEQTTIVVPLSIHLTILCFLNEMPQSSLIHFRITTFVESHIVSTNALIKIGKERNLVHTQACFKASSTSGSNLKLLAPIGGSTLQPASVISPSFSSLRTRSLFSSVQGLFFLRGEKRW